MTLKHTFTAILSLTLFSQLAFAEVVGLTPGQFRVDESGAATYSIPIASPQGRAGVNPPVSLSYSSANMAEGIAGVGWSVSATSSISRCPATPINDQEIRAVNYTNEDKLCLNGRRLILISGTYLEKGSTYRFELDDFSTVTAVGVSGSTKPTYFKVENKAGETHYYGKTNSVHAHFDGQDDGFVEPGGFALNSMAKSWMLKVVEDVKGNYIVYNYDKTTAKGTAYLESIEYAGNTNTNKYPFAKIEFKYRDYVKGFKGYYAGAYIHHNQLLERIETSIDNDIYRTYFLEYEESNFIEERTLLTSIQECPDNDTNLSNCRLPTTFQWQRPALSSSSMVEVCDDEPGMEDFCHFVPTSTNYTPFPDDFTLTTSAPGFDTTQVLDINGDGFSDLVFVDSGNWRVRLGPYLNSSVQMSNIATSQDEFALNIDTNGDGVRELLVADSDIANWHVISYQQVDYSGEFCLPGSPCMPFSYQSDISVRDLGVRAMGLEGEAQVMDVDGDGDEDIVFRNFNQIKAHINNGSGGFTTTKVLYNFSTSPDSTVLNDDYQSQTADMKSASQIDINGDGRSDLIMKVTTTTGGCTTHFGFDPTISTQYECIYDHGGSWNTNISTNNKVFVSQEADGIGMDDPELVEVISLSASYDNIRVADFNGDGLSDIAYVASNTWYYRLSDGTTLLPSREMGLVTSSSLKYLNQFVDLNGDGRADVLHATANNNWHVYFSRPTEDAQWLVFENRGTRSFEANSVVRFGDTSGDGRMELLTSKGSNWKKHYDASRVGIKEYTIETITNGYGVETSIEYAPMTDDSVYIIQASDANLDSDVFSPISGAQLVKEVTTQTGLILSEVSVQYQYGGLLIHKKGRGNLGFQMLRTIDMQTNVVSETRYSQAYAEAGNDFAKAHMPVYSEQRLNGQLMSRATNQLNVIPTAQGGSFPYIMTSTEESYVLGSDMISTHINTTVTNSEFDTWGNLTDSDILMTDVATSETIRTITANVFGNADEQEKGRLQSTTVSKQRTGDANPTLRETEFNYYPNGMLEYSTFAPNVSERQLKTTYLYDDYGNKKQVLVEGYANSGEPNQVRISKTVYDSRGRYVNYTDNSTGAFRIRTNYRYNGLVAGTASGVTHNIKTISSNKLHTTTYYTPFQEVSEVHYPDSRIKQITRSFCNGCVTGYYIKVTETENGSPDKEVYLNKWSQTIHSQIKGFDGTWWYTRTTYDEQGRPDKVYEPNSSTEFTETEYDDIGRAYRVTKPNGGVVEVFFDGLETRTNDERNYDSYHYSNGFGETASTKDSLDGVVTFTYDAFGNLTDTLTVAEGKTSAISNVFDKWGYKTQMNDPIKGQWDYTYNAFGEIVTQTSARNHTISFYHDKLGRKIRSYEPSEGTLCWTYGTSTETSIKAVGKLKSKAKYEGQNVACSTTNTPTIKHEYTYDSRGRPFQHKTSIAGGTPYVQSQTYDSYSRPDITTYPTGTVSVGANANYNGYGYLKEIVRADDNYPLKIIMEMDIRGNITKTKAGNNVITEYTFDDEMGWMDGIFLTKGASLYSLAIGHDLRGNVKTRHSVYASPTSNPSAGKDYMETYHYDALNRLEQRDVTLTTGILPSDLSGEQTWTYDGFGNIKSRKNVHSNTEHFYQYANDNVYRLAGVYNNAGYTGTPSFKFHTGSISNPNFSQHYDANGNITSDNTRSLVYSSFDKPTSITKGSASSTMSYGVDRELYYKDDTVIENGQVARYQRYYMGAYEKVIRTGGHSNMVEHKYNIAGAVITYHDGSRITSFVHTDNQGSIVATTNYLGVVQTQALYEPFGTQSIVYEVPVYGTNNYGPITEKGYTGHRQMDHVGIIHMNGRIYDPTLGRFLQADPFIQAPMNSQSYNRYAYVLNNPMSYTDPSGYFFKKLGKFVKKYWRVAAAVAISYVTFGAASQWAAGWALSSGFSASAAGFIGATVGGAAAGYASGAILTGSLKGALKGAFTGAITGGLMEGIAQYGFNTSTVDGLAGLIQLEKAGVSQETIAQLYGSGGGRTTTASEYKEAVRNGRYQFSPEEKEKLLEALSTTQADAKARAYQQRLKKDNELIKKHFGSSHSKIVKDVTKYTNRISKIAENTTYGSFVKVNGFCGGSAVACVSPDLGNYIFIEPGFFDPRSYASAINNAAHTGAHTLTHEFAHLARMYNHTILMSTTTSFAKGNILFQMRQAHLTVNNPENYAWYINGVP